MDINNIKSEKYLSSYLSESNKSFQEKKQRYYYLFKKGDKYLLKKKKNKENNIKNLIKKKVSNISKIESHIKFLFNYKYTKTLEYDNIIINRLIYDIDSKITTNFKENLLLYDNNEFIYKFYEKNKCKQSLKKLINYYDLNNIIYPNYIPLYEGNYIFNNIGQKQKIIDRLERYKNKEINEKNNVDEEENILNSNVVESILNQTNTSETKRIFGIKDDNTSKYNDDNDDINQIYSLIKNIDMIENNKNKAKIFKKKNMIRIVNHIKNKIKIRNNNNNINKIIYIKNIQKSPFAKLLSTISYFGNNKNTNTIKGKENINSSKEYFSSIFSKYYNDLINKRNVNKSKIHKRINTLDINKTSHKNTIILYNTINNKKSFKSPYIIKRPINLDNITYSKKKITKNITSVNSHKNSKSSNINTDPDIHIDSDYFNLDNNFNDIKLYRKKMNGIKIDNDIKINQDYINHKLINQNYENKIEKEYIKSKPVVNHKQLSIPIHTYKSSVKNNSIKNNKNKRITPNQSPNFKLISKMIKLRYLTDDKIYKTINSTHINSGNTKSNFNYENNNSNIKEYNNKNYTTKNIYISNNITNNNYYSINNGKNKKNNFKLIIFRNKKKNEGKNKRNINKPLIKENKLNKNGNLYINTENSRKKINEEYFSRNNNYTFINKHKNGLIDSTTLKRLDNNNLNSLLNNFGYEKLNVEKKISLSNSKIKYTTINEI